MNSGLIVLWDYDSMIYKAVYRIVTLADIRKWFKDKRSRDWMEREIMNLTINRLSNMGDAILADIEDTGIEIHHAEYFLTACRNSARKAAYPLYKAKRPFNKWVAMVRRELLTMNFAVIDDRWEADDLIKERALQIGEDGYVICSIDKDLKQIHGIHFDYYRPVLKDENGNAQLDENGFRLVAPCRGLSVVSKSEAKSFFWKQMLTGDAGDNIPGVPGIGQKRAEKLLHQSDDYETTVKDKYIEVFGQDEGIRQFELHRLLIGLGIDNRL